MNGARNERNELNAPSGSAVAWWCTSHRREATHVDAKGHACCDPKLGGILLPCYTKIIEQNTEIAHSEQNH